MRRASFAVGVACWIVSTTAAAADDRAKSAELQERIGRLEASVNKVEAIRAVKRLQHAYGHYAELGLWNDFADLFADNAVGHYPAGPLVGRESIRKLFFQDVGNGRLGLADGRLYPHIVLQPVVSLGPDGTTAKGRWHVLAMLGGYGGTATWAGGVYENEYLLENGAWKISDLHYYGQFSGRYEAAGFTAANEAIPFHYDPARAGTPILNTTRQPGTAAGSNVGALRARVGDLTLRTQRLNDETDVANLQHAYGYYVDRKMWDDVADLFAEEGTLELDQRGVYVGKASIRRALNQFGPQGLREGEQNDHQQLQTLVHVAHDGLTANARGSELAMSGGDSVGRQWADKGWAKNAKPAPGSSREFPPDRPPTEVYEIYPKFHIAPFHYANPATGRATQYPPDATAANQVEAGGKTVGAGLKTRPNADDLERSLARAERAFEVAQAHDAVENLASAYSYYADEYLWDRAADLFARDGRMALPAGGKPEGALTIRLTTEPVIHVAADGRSAKLRMRLFQLGNTSDGNGTWASGIYEGRAVNDDGVWKLTSLDLHDVWTAGYRGRWVHAGGKADMPFHYKNPVTGRPPAVLLP